MSEAIAVAERRAANLDDATTRLVDYLLDVTPPLLARRSVPGAVVGIGRAGRLCWEGAFGTASVAQGRPTTPDSVFRSGSIGKTFTATAVMRLVEAGLLDLDAPVNDYLDFAVTNPLGERDVTVLDLLSHRSGLASNSAACSYEPAMPLADHLRAEMRQDKRDLFRRSLPRWTAPVGERMQYSNTGLALAGLVVERANPGGESFAAYTRRTVLEPLDMRSSFFTPSGGGAADLDAEVASRLTAGHSVWGARRHETADIRLGDYPAGAAVTTAGDLVRFLLEQQAALRGDGSLLSAESARRMVTPVMQIGGGAAGPDDTAMCVGVGWWLADRGRPTEWFGHGGAHMWGWQNEFRCYPQLDLAIVVLTNGWEMSSYLSGNLTPTLPTQLIAFAVDHLRADAGESLPWPWKVGYAAGVVNAVTNAGFLGMDTTPPPGAVEAVRAGMSGDGLPWDDEGFAAGLADAGAADLTFAGIDAFLSSDSCRLTRAELDAAWCELGGTGLFPLPGAWHTEID